MEDNLNDDHNKTINENDMLLDENNEQVNKDNEMENNDTDEKNDFAENEAIPNENENVPLENFANEDESRQTIDEENEIENEIGNDQINDEKNNIEEELKIEEDGIDTKESRELGELNETIEESQLSVNNLIESIIDNIIDNVINRGDEVRSEEILQHEFLGEDGFPEHQIFDAIEEAPEPEETAEGVDDRRSGRESQMIEFEATEKEEEDFQSNFEAEAIEDDDKQEEVEEEVKLSKEELIQELRNALIEGANLRKFNTSFQHKIGDYMRKRRAEQTSAAIADEKDIIDFEQKYEKQMDTLKQLIEEYVNDTDQYKIKIDYLQNETTSREEKVKNEKEKFQTHRALISQKSINTRTGKSIPIKDLEDIIANEEKKETLVVETRLISIKLQNEVNKIESILKSKEELADGLHLIDFEQFKIENQSYNEKLEERTEDLLKLRKKITSNVHILTHVKEKLEFVKYECDLEQNRLTEIDEKLTQGRDQLTSFKQTRDRLRSSNQKFKKSCGMLGNRDLLRNYEDSVDTVEMQVAKMNEMKNRQIKLTLRNQALQMKIENARMEGSNG